MTTERSDRKRCECPKCLLLREMWASKMPAALQHVFLRELINGTTDTLSQVIDDRFPERTEFVTVVLTPPGEHGRRPVVSVTGNVQPAQHDALLSALSEWFTEQRKHDEVEARAASKVAQA